MKIFPLIWKVAWTSYVLSSTFEAQADISTAAVSPFSGTNSDIQTTLVASYIPFLGDKPWPTVPVVRFVEIDTNRNVWGHPVFPKNFPTMQEVHDPDTDFATVALHLPNGEVYKTYNDFVLGPYLSEVYSGDFNGDGVPDYFAIKPTSGCGIAGEQNFGVFAFSEGTNSYRFTRVSGWGMGPHSLAMDPASKTFRFMQTTLCDAKDNKGRYHTFWVHRFFRWEHGSMDQDHKLSPIWVQYLLRPNHEPTKLLTPRMKAKAWAEHLDEHDSIEQ